MLPLEKCEELKNAGYPVGRIGHYYCNGVIRYRSRVAWGCDEETDIPSGDELLAECGRLLRADWELTRTTFRNALDDIISRTTITDMRNDKIFKSDFSCNNSDLADLWLWLNERKKVKE